MKQAPREEIVLVNENGEPIGIAEKLAAHHADTPLHLAFSCYVFNDKGEFLVIQRAHNKKVWPGVWTNSVCGHPAPGEAMKDAIARRLNYELGMTARAPQLLIPDYTYQTPPFRGIIEHEFCPVYAARATSPPHPNPEEVADFKWIPWHEYVQAAKSDTNDTWSWWCKDQLRIIEHLPEIQTYIEP